MATAVAFAMSSRPAFGDAGLRLLGLADQRAHHVDLPTCLRLSVVAELFNEPVPHGLVLVTSIGASTEEISKDHVVAPLRASVIDDVEVSHPVPRPNFSGEDVTSVVACVTTVDPPCRLKPCADRAEVVMPGQSDGKIDDRLGEEPQHR